MGSTGCGFLLLAFLAVLVGFVPFLEWTNYVVALPLALIAAGMFASSARKRTAQPADHTFLWVSAGWMILVIGRLWMLQA